jgi:hypothetical protein
MTRVHHKHSAAKKVCSSDAYDVAATYAPERTQISVSPNDGFWLQGGGVEAAVNFQRGLGLVASVSGGHASNVTPGVDVNKVVVLGGERYTHTVWRPRKGPARDRHLELFGQWLFGSVHGFGGVYPASGGVKSSATAFAMQAGGGMNLALSRHFGLRLLDVEFLQTALPNNGSITQNDLRLATGITVHFGASTAHR